MITGTKEYLDSIAKDYVCSEHGTRLGVVWRAKEDSYVIHCGKDHYPEEITREPSRTKQWKQGKLPAVDPEFSLMPKTDLGSGELLIPELVKALVAYARKYLLDPARGHVVLMYSKPYITIDGYLYHANQLKMPYQLKSHPLSEDERKTYQIPDGAHAWLSEASLGEGEKSFLGLGVVTQEEMTAKSKRDETKLASPVVAAHPWQLAQKRAEWQALRRAFPIGESGEEHIETGD